MYKATLLRDLCTCHTRLKEAERAHEVCGKHTQHDSGSAASKLLWAEALVLNALYEEVTLPLPVPYPYPSPYPYPYPYP